MKPRHRSKFMQRVLPGPWSWALWPLAVYWLVTVGRAGWELFQVGSRGVIVGGVLMIFSPLPLAVLVTRELPSVARRAEIRRRRKLRLQARLAAQAREERAC